MLWGGLRDPQSGKPWFSEISLPLWQEEEEGAGKLWGTLHQTPKLGFAIQICRAGPEHREAVGVMFSPLQGLEILPRGWGGLAEEGLCWVASQACGPVPLRGGCLVGVTSASGPC